jgi:hypothetical protein
MPVYASDRGPRSSTYKGIDLTDAELAAVAAAIRRAIEDDRFPRAPRLDPLRAALAKLDPKAPTAPASSQNRPNPKSPRTDLLKAVHPRTPRREPNLAEEVRRGLGSSSAAPAFRWTGQAAGSDRLNLGARELSAQLRVARARGNLGSVNTRRLRILPCAAS